MKENVSKHYITRLAIIASLGGFLFGYDTAVISGTINFVALQFHLDSISTGWYVSSALIGSIMGVTFAGTLSDKYGRKNVLTLSSILFAISGLGCAFAFGFTDLVVYRFIGGLGIGVASMLSPLYISEISPANKRGRLVALYQFAITLGILCSYIINAYLVRLSHASWVINTTGLVNKIMVSEVWRIMLGMSSVPAILFLILLLFVPESPRWLAIRGYELKAYNVLKKIVGSKEAKKEISEIKVNLSQEAGGFDLLFKGGFRLAIIIGISLAFLTQVSGINAVIYYGPKILEEAGLPVSDALGGQVIIGIVNVVFTIIAIWKIDHFGRKPLLLAGVIGIIVSLVILGFLFYVNTSNSYLLLTFILLFIACFAFSYGPVIWVLLSEFFPGRIRGKAMSLATFAIWFGTALVGQLTPMLLERLKPAGTFWLFAAMTSPALYIALKIMPETKGKTLEEIEQYWLSKKPKAKMYAIKK